jgi:hypothetical protein
VSSKDHLQPGDEVPTTFRLHYLRHLWRRNAIGAKGDAWTAYMLGFLARRQGRKGAADAPDVAAKAREHGHEGVVGSEVRIEVENRGGGWFRVLGNGEELVMLRGPEAVEEWLEKNGLEKAL